MKRLRSWVMASRLKTLTAGLIPVFVGTALVYATGYDILWGIASCALISALFIQVGTNLFNDAIDYKKGADTEERLGPQRATQSGEIPYKSVMWGGIFCFAVAVAFGIPLVIQGGWPIVIIGLVSLFFGYAYTGGPYPLAYIGLGDLFVVIFFGLVAVGGVYYLQTHTWSVEVVLAGLQVGFLATVLIAINNLRDVDQDKAVNKRTLAVRFGKRFAKFEISFLLISSFLSLFFWLSFDYIWAAVLPFFALPSSIGLLRKISKAPTGEVYNDFLAKAAGIHILFGCLVTLGLFMS